MVKTSAVAQQVLDLFQHVHGDKGFGVPGINDPVNEPTVAPITGYNNPAPNGYQKAPKFQSKNKLADDAARRASKACPDKVLPVMTQTRGHSIASNVDVAMARHLDTFRARQFEKQPPGGYRSLERGEEDSDAFAVNCVKHKAVLRQDLSDMNPIYFPAEPRSPAIIRIGAPAGVWKEDLDLDLDLGKRKTSSKPPTQRESRSSTPNEVWSNKGQRRAGEWDGELPKQDEALKKGQPAYYTVTINKAFSLQFS
ncbi:uncharacterized protein FFB20_14399 [Fusarium fujikuroi]|uniref:Uncharacterized protein n=2 Tax=Fusarium fujikuroi TaxID=5127 RepID=S0E1C5_GIBF5|nr:uncharacterized protein FFUJ_07459 [Fusarium fujikuroi IMI 58289]KLP10689.1 uncharacterized protein Y057_9299 [Fusarium fujikuroi]KLP18706.1 uncharacterized protein LW94_6172 [Fusarium fujikuroi]CCT68654.1 uncharacterized protein FFUJ_07459 [Fusarium fujikuroi IMI 58289]SCN91752.1 uncharacterized protein FFM5_05139 [Fusarium fujikuroi]SCO13885.1 uncharacterized protein FFB20_14399 [Fusarium fujikuroi]